LAIDDLLVISDLDRSIKDSIFLLLLLLLLQRDFLRNIHPILLSDDNFDELFQDESYSALL
jgi:hypothetical protein